MMAPITSSLVAFMASSLIQPVSFSLKNAISGKRVMKVGEVIEKEKALPLEKTLSLMMKGRGKGVTRAERRFNNVDNVFFCSIL